MGQHGLHLCLGSGMLCLSGLGDKLCEKDVQLALACRLAHAVIGGQDDQEAQKIGKALQPHRDECKPLQQAFVYQAFCVHGLLY